MPRYIDADKVVKWSYSEPRYSDSVNDRTDLRDFLLSLPTLSTDEVRGKGCPVCKCNLPLPEVEGMSHEYYIRGNTLYHFDTHFGWEGAEISYCPECGARLEVSEDA